MKLKLLLLSTMMVASAAIHAAASQAEPVQPIAPAKVKDAAARAGPLPPRLAAFRWLLEELRVSLFAQELRTPMPVSLKRVERTWAELSRLD